MRDSFLLLWISACGRHLFCMPGGFRMYQDGCASGMPISLSRQSVIGRRPRRTQGGVHGSYAETRAATRQRTHRHRVAPGSCLDLRFHVVLILGCGGLLRADLALPRLDLAPHSATVQQLPFCRVPARR
jgi:hypothetical protein